MFIISHSPFKALIYSNIGGPAGGAILCQRLPVPVQEKTFFDAMKWMLIDNKGGVGLTLEGNKSPKPADFAAAFPCHSPDFSAQKSAPGGLSTPLDLACTTQRIKVR